MIYGNNYIKYTTLPYSIFQPLHTPYAKLNLFPYIFCSFYKVRFLFFTKHIFCGTGLITMALQAKLFSRCFSKSYSMVMNFPKCCSNSALCNLFEMNTASVTSKRCCKWKRVVTSSCVLRKLLLFIVKRFYNLLYKPICSLLRLLSYWESINSHS